MTTTLFRDVVDELRALLARPAREADDWSIDFGFRCKCRDCAELQRFVRSSRQEFDWPLNAERRRHIHGAIDAPRLPISHVTARRGSPFVLQLRKEPSLFEREAAYRDALRGTLDELESARSTL